MNNLPFKTLVRYTFQCQYCLFFCFVFYYYFARVMPTSDSIAIPYQIYFN